MIGIEIGNRNWKNLRIEKIIGIEIGKIFSD